MATFDPIQYKHTTQKQWQEAAAAWNQWGPTLEQWLGSATEQMLDLAELRPGKRVLDLAAGTGGQTLVAARRVGATGAVLATDISSNILAFAAENAGRSGLGREAGRARQVDGREQVCDAARFEHGREQAGR